MKNDTIRLFPSGEGGMKECSPPPHEVFTPNRIKTTHLSNNEAPFKGMIPRNYPLMYMCFTYKTILKKVDIYYTKTLVLTWCIPKSKRKVNQLENIILLQPNPMKQD